MELANHGLILLQQLNAQREFGFLCDCTVAIGDVFFKAHKAVLAAFSNYFRMLFIHQDSDCVRLKPADIQPDIFSYLLNLMYTGKLAPQLIDPVRLEQGVKFLHAYPLLQEVSLTAFSHAEQGLPLAAAAAAAASLYGIQISDQQSGLSGQLPARSRLPSPFEPEALVDGRHEAEAVAGESPSLAEEHVQQVPAPNAILHVKPSIMKRSAHFRKLYTCHLCGSRFTQRILLREHLQLHCQAPPPQLPLIRAPPLPAAEAEESQRSADTLQAETPPPPDIADIDNLENGGPEREAKRRRYECATCGRKFIQKSHWREHMYIHTGKPYRCSACGKSFCRANQAARHVCCSQGADVYTVVNRQSVELCGLEENSPVEALFLASDRPYKCNVCEATFSSPGEVVKHLCFTQNVAGFRAADSPGLDHAAPHRVVGPCASLWQDCLFAKAPKPCVGQ
uniref:Zinc finger and BTB domain containing 2b n=1 Tax=Scleropages formosus TaxID=113540 RepID=A0A8D0CKE9_SCLFO